LSLLDPLLEFRVSFHATACAFAVAASSSEAAGGSTTIDTGDREPA
jgi:hypothetical protein